MPQLNPAPWLLFMGLSWLVFAAIVPTKVVKYIENYNPAPKNISQAKTRTWIWPWS
uniref:ATP synthase F0 subunit 8 n=1 Tax=Atheresthes evermanni TaxID=195645 RepID=UPI0028FC9AB1|nr:ATP synthase F0 subunit 8 [Atheresthes evermanni]YP_010960552.1 ATP synthase F0 subunit 8 [Atheresthes stomias]WNH19922.1 ATP synthase F0 subunit 8 [Atheresthes stomias]WNH37942.1 ATP synthase F0 subunit 8 [Atheresthes evermanni]WNH37955.1 ATP synthase F0 subunit 8 [Atheresthes stomias]